MKNILEISKEKQKNLFAFLQEIVTIPSVGGNEAEAVLRIKEEMESLNYDEVRIDGLGNCIGIIGSGPRLLAIDGHCDTVDVGQRENWEVEPYSGMIKDGVLYGRGASDQKGGLAAAIYAGKIVQEMGIPDDVTLMVVASVLEEDFEGLCWQYLHEKENIHPEAVLLTEPSNLSIATGQRGRMEMKVEIRGVSCHGSAPERGDNAITKAAPIIQEIDALNKRLSSSSVLGKGSITVTDIRSSAPSLCAVADRAVLHIDRRLTEGETLETCMAEVQNLTSVQKAKAKVTVPDYHVKSHTGIEFPIEAYYPMWLMEENHPLVRTAVKAYGILSEEAPKMAPWVFSTNGVATKGLYDIPTIGFGPGEEVYAHAPNDQIRLSDVEKAMQYYTSFVMEWAKGR